MDLKTTIFTGMIVATVIPGCADIKKAKVAAQHQDYAVAKEHWQDLADLGFPEGFIGLGEIAEITAEQDNAAIKYYQRAYDLGYEQAAYHIGKFYYKHHITNQELKLARHWLVKAAEQGNTNAYMLYAEMQLSGLGVAKNSESALSIYKDLADHGYASASKRLASFYEKGLNVEPDKAKALEYYRLAVQQGSLEAELDIGRFYTYGYSVDTDFDKAESIYLRYAESGHPQAAFLLSELYKRQFIIEKKPVLVKSIEWRKFSADKGYIPAKISIINQMLADDSNNIERAVNALKNLSKLKEGKASYQLGRLISTGKIAANTKDALEYYLLAYEQGYELAAYRIAEFYFTHQHNSQGLQQAKQWQEKAIQQNTDNAQLLQAEFILAGRNGWQQNKIKAFKIYQTLSEQGMHLASRELAKIFEKGIYIKKNLGKALFYFERAATQGDIYAKLNVANYYANGLGVEPDWPRAQEIFLHYANAGYRKAAYLLAKNLEQQSALTGQKTLDKAIHWYQIAAEKNYIPAQLRITEMMLTGRGLSQNIEKAKTELGLMSEQGVAKASFRLGEYYSDVQNADLKQALHFYQLAFEQGSQESVSKLAELYQQKTGVQNNSVRDSYIKSANTGNIYSAYLLGILYEANSEDKVALYWYKKAAKTGNAKAQIALANSYRKMGEFKAANKWLVDAVKAGDGLAMLQYGDALYWGQKIKGDRIKGLAYVLSASRLHVKNAVAKSLSLMVNLNSTEKIELANQLSKSSLQLK